MAHQDTRPPTASLDDIKALDSKLRAGAWVVGPINPHGGRAQESTTPGPNPGAEHFREGMDGQQDPDDDPSPKEPDRPPLPPQDPPGNAQHEVDRDSHDLPRPDPS
jgi:hypothetical protein